MGNSKLRGKDLRKINYKDNVIIARAIELMAKEYKYLHKNEKLDILKELKSNPQKFIGSNLEELIYPQEDGPKSEQGFQEIAVRSAALPFSIFGKKLIDEKAIDQMKLAMTLPVAKFGALMPDAHHGYGIPIGAALATENHIIPYAVGLDIGCRMSLSLYDVDARYLNKHQYKFKQSLKDNTNFGTGGHLPFRQEHEVLDREEFQITPLLRKLKGKAAKQLGSSGSGNHFVEFGLVEILAENHLGIHPGNYVGILAHSGSRGFGATIAKEYTERAIEQCHLPRNIQQLAWLDMNTELGQEYWIAMNLAGDYAKACHDRIHLNLAKSLGLKSIGKIENHHNFAWKEKHGKNDLIVHRKGATPAHENELGIIPGSMTTKAFLVKGRGNSESLQSASHGAGRKLSRTKMKNSFTMSELKKTIKKHKLELIGGSTDEAPYAYKNIDEVMRYQKDLVEVIGSFLPKIIRMDKP